MKRRTKTIIAATALGATLATGAGIAAANGSGESETEAPITGSELDRASAAALEHLGEGRVTDTEIGDEESYYEVEVTLDSGDQVDVQLDESFTVVGQENDGNEAEDGSDD